MRKLNQTLLIIGVLCMAIPGFAQTLAEWPLNTMNGLSPSPYNTTNISNVSDFTRGNGIGSIIVSNDGASTRGWNDGTSLGTVDYYEVCITPQSGVSLQIDALKFDESRSIDGPKAYEVYWSTDGFISSTRIDSTGISPNDVSVRTRNISGIDLGLCDGQQLCFRWYAYDASDSNGTWQIEDESLKIEGSVGNTCTAPTTPVPILSLSSTSSTLQITAFSGGNGDERLIVIKEGSAVSGIPCSGNSFTANSTFGMGDQIASGEYVVFSGAAMGGGLTSVTVTGLTEGRTYYVAVFEYNNPDFCYLQNNPKTGSKTTNCTLPDEVKSPLFTIANGEIMLSWTAPYCYDDVLIIASTADVLGTPTGNGSDYSADPIYGNGSDTGMNFAGDEYPVSLGSGTNATITGLSLNTTYYLKIFTRLGTTWSSGLEITASTATGCPDLNNDVAFINEFHYQNVGDDIDEGVEIVGPKGINLAAYQLHFYQNISLTECEHYKTVPLSGIIDNEDGSYGAVWFPIPDIYDGGAGAIALYNTLTNTVVQFVGYRKDLLAVDGIASGLTSDAIRDSNGSIVTEVSTQGTGESMQLSGSGPCPSDHSWQRAPETMGNTNAGQALPVELIAFAAKKIEQQVILEWSTSSEHNNDYFLVERSRNASDFDEIGKITGAGNSTTFQQYNLWDKTPLDGINYYRLRQVDFDGQSRLSKVVTVLFNSIDVNDIQVYPTITSDKLNIKFSQITEADASLDIFDLNGRKVFSQILTQGSTLIELQTDKLHKGQYLLRIRQNQVVQVTRFIKM